MRFTSYHATSETSPVNPNSGISIRATITSVWPLCSRRKLSVRIHRHDGAVANRELAEHRNEHPQWSQAAVGVRHRDGRGVGRGPVIARASLPGLARRHEVELLSIDHGAAVQLVVPCVNKTGRLVTGRGRLCDADLAEIREGDARACAGQHALDGGDYVRVDGGGVRRLAGAAAESTAPVHEGARDSRTFPRRGGHGHRDAQYRADLDQPEDQEEQQGWKDDRELDQSLGVLAPEEAGHSCGSARVIDASVNVTLVPAKRTKLVSQKCWYVTRTP